MSIAIYAGTFDPITLGHLAIVKQAARIFAHVRVLVAVNPNKQTLLPLAERAALIDELVGRMPQVSVDTTASYVVEYARQIGAGFLIRGIRTSTDADFEINLAKANRELAPEIATIFLPAEPALAHISSTDVKAAARCGQDVSELCPPQVAARLRELVAGCSSTA